jgi:hypothetical protein
MNKKMKNKSGTSLIATVLTLLIFSLFIAIAVSLVTTGSNIAVQEEQGTDAFYIADGGLEYAHFALTQNADWYRSTTDPIQITSTNLGAGSFTVNINLPATRLSRRLRTTDTVAIVYTTNLTNRFPSSGSLQIEDDIVQYTGIVGNTFTGITGISSAHSRGEIVYPVTTLSNGLASLGSPCTPTSAASFNIAYHLKFLTAGTIDIEGEEISYTSSTVAGGVMTLNGVTRCLNLTSSAHSSGATVTPILFGGDTADYQAEIISTGTVTNPLAVNVVRTVRKTVQR